jgi:hypothetical protein
MSSEAVYKVTATLAVYRRRHWMQHRETLWSVFAVPTPQLPSPWRPHREADNFVREMSNTISYTLRDAEQVRGRMFTTPSLQTNTYTHIYTLLYVYCAHYIPVIIGATGIVSKSLQKYLETIPGQHSIDSLQKNCHTRNITHHKESATS